MSKSVCILALASVVGFASTANAGSIAYQGFEADGGSWGFAPSVSRQFVDLAHDRVWQEVDSRSTTTDVPGKLGAGHTGHKFWGIGNLGEPATRTLTFDDLDLSASGYTSVQISFDYAFTSFDRAGNGVAQMDALSYTLNGVTTQLLDFDVNDVSSNGWLTATVDVLDIDQPINFSVTVNQRGADQAGWDNFEIIGVSTSVPLPAGGVLLLGGLAGLGLMRRRKG